MSLALGVTTAQMKEAVARYFSGDEWALTWEVSASTGGGAGRRIDAIAMNLWPSRGLGVNGVEIKVSRSDWLRELADPAKAEELHRLCDYWWLAVGPNVIKDLEEVPVGWGVLEWAPRKGKELELGDEPPPQLRMKRRPMFTDRGISLRRPFVAALLQGFKRTDKEQIDGFVDAAYRRGYAAGKQEAERFRVVRREDGAALLDKLEKALGMKASEWGWSDHEEICRAVAFVLKVGPAKSWEGLAQVFQELDSFVQLVDALRDRFDGSEAAALCPVPKEEAGLFRARRWLRKHA